MLHTIDDIPKKEKSTFQSILFQRNQRLKEDKNINVLQHQTCPKILVELMLPIVN